MISNLDLKPRWADLEGKELADEISAIARDLYDTQSYRRERYQRNNQLFELRPVNGSTASYYTGDVGLDHTLGDYRGLLRSAVQTAVAEIYAKQKPTAKYQTSGASWKTRRKAKKLDKLEQGLLRQRQGRWVDVWALTIDNAVETVIQGAGVIRVEPDLEAGQITHEPIPCCEVYTDPHEGREPRTWVYIPECGISMSEAIRRYVDTETSEEEKARKREAILRGKPVILNENVGRIRAAKQVQVYEAWRVADGPDLPGKHVVVIGGEVMVEREWKRTRPPFAMWHWEPHRDGVWGSGIIYEAERLAVDASDLWSRILGRARIASGKRTYFREGSVDKELLKLNDEEVLIAVAQGAEFPQESLVPPFTPADFDTMQAAVQSVFDTLGISQVSAAARREQGVESGTAMRTLNDTKSGRQLVKAQNFERLFVDLAYQHAWCLADLVEHNAAHVVKWPGGRAMVEMKAADALVEDGDFSVNVASQSALPNDPWGRLEMVKELKAEGAITQPTYLQLLNWPDLDKEMDAGAAEYEYVDMLIERYLDAEESDWDAGDYESPEGFIIDKERALMRFASAYFQSKVEIQMLPKSERAKAQFNLELLRRYIHELDEMLQRAAAQQGEMAQAGVQPGMVTPGLTEAPGMAGGAANVPAAAAPIAA